MSITPPVIKGEKEVVQRARELADMIPDEGVFKTVESLYEAKQKGMLDPIRTLTLAFLGERLRDQLK